MRQYLIGSWNNADGYDYSGEQLMGNRNGASRRVHFNEDGSAAVQNYGDDKPAKKIISVADRILPQRKRVQTLTQQMQELVADYKAGNMSIEEYSTLLAVVSAKRTRAEQLLKKAVSVKPPFEQVEVVTKQQPVKASVVETTPTTHTISSHIKQKACQVWTEARMFLVGSVAACAGLLWLTN